MKKLGDWIEKALEKIKELFAPAPTPVPIPVPSGRRPR